MNNSKRLSINLISSIISYGSSIIVSFILTPYLINTLGKEAYSFYPLANNFITYMSVLSNTLNSMASRFITVELSRNNLDDANKYFSSILFSDIILSAILFLPMVLIIMFIDRILNVPINLLGVVRTLFSFSFASMLVNIITSVFGVATFAKNRIDLRSLREIITSVTRLVILYLLFKFFSPSIVYVGITAFIISLLNFLIQNVYTKVLLPEIKVKISNFRAKLVKKVLASGVWNSINSLGNMLLTSTALVMANIFFGASVAGEYSIVQTVPTFINGIISQLTMCFYPTITIAYAQSRKKDLLSELKKAQTLVGYFSISIISVFIGLSYDFFSLWTPNENYSKLVILSTITIMPHCIIGCTWILSYLNTALNKVKTPAIFLVFCGFVNILTVYIVYTFFSVGVEFIPLISSVLQIIWAGVFFPLYSSKLLAVPQKTFFIAPFRGVVGCLVGILLTLLFKGLFKISTWLQFFCVAIIVGTIILTINLFIIVPSTYRKNIIKYLKIK